MGLVKLKETISLCPLTLKKVKAEIIKERSEIFLIKRDINGYIHKILLDKSSTLYERTICLNNPKTIDFNKIMIDITTRCNLNCPVCYRDRSSQQDLSFELLKTLALKYQEKIISLCGGEPTIRKDLPEIIKLFAKRNSVFLVTNGIRLVDYDYLKNLKEKGLQYISFSFNGLSDDVYKKINGEPLLNLKLKALNNIKKTGIKTILSVLIVKGINENQINGILEYCLRNRDFIEELRIRTMVPIGEYIHNEKYHISDLLDLVCKAINIKEEDVLCELELKSKVNSFFAKEIFILRSCSFDFHLRRYKNDIIPVGRNIEIDRIKGYKYWKILLPFELIKAYGVKMAIIGFLKNIFKYERRPWIHSSNIFKIGLRSWPDKYDIDIEENKKCQTGYYLNGKVMSFCYANILSENRDSIFKK